MNLRNRNDITEAIFSSKKQLYKRLCPSARLLVLLSGGPSVCWSVSLSVGPSVRQSGVSRKPQIQVNSTKYNKIQQNSIKFETFYNYWPGDALVELTLSLDEMDYYRSTCVMRTEKETGRRALALPATYRFNNP